MFSMINSLFAPFKAVCQHVLNVFVGMLPHGVLWNLLGLALFIVSMAAILYGVVLLLRKLHSGTYVRQITWPYTISHIILGAALGIAGLVNPCDEKWKMILLVAFAGWVAIALLLMVKRIFGFENPPHGKLLYLMVGIAYGVELLAVGMVALLVAYAAIALVIIVVVGVGVACGGAKSMFPGSSGGGGGGGSVQRRETTLDDGTRIVEEGIGWREVGGSSTYRENFDGSFSKTS